MITNIIEPDYNWKQAATQEGVDYGAVQRAFMDQSYSVVANKAKILFQDPFRLGFEIVHRNEKATKMVGIFAFRVNNGLLYAPTFFVNGEIKPADMLYRADVKRFVPLTEDWCAFLARGVHEKAGEPVGKNRRRQSDSYLDRLAYPQRTKYASEMEFGPFDAARFGDGPWEGWAEGMSEARDAFVKAARDGSLWNELLAHAAEDSPVRLLIPEVIREQGPEALEKLASAIGGSDVVARHVAASYTREQLEDVGGWEKRASENAPRPALEIILSPALAKSAASRDRVFDRGYDILDYRAGDQLNSVVEEVGDGWVKELSAPGKVTVLLDGGKLEEAILLRRNPDMLDAENGDRPCDVARTSYPHGEPELVYFPSNKQLLHLQPGQDVFGDEMIDRDTSASTVGADKLSEGKCYVALGNGGAEVSGVFHVDRKTSDGECTKIETSSDWGSPNTLFYAPGRNREAGPYISDGTLFLEVAADVDRSGDEYPNAGAICGIKCKGDKVLMSPSGVDQWIRTAGGVTSSRDVRVSPSDLPGTFDIRHTEGGTILKEASALGWLPAQLSLAEDFEIHIDKAGEILEQSSDRPKVWRVYDTAEKRAYVTRSQDMENWIQAYDPELQVRLDAPQRQVLSTYTPRRPDQISRYGDTYQRVPAENSESGSELLPMDAVMSQSPEQLAQMSAMLGMPHVFDHGCVGQMATSSFSIADQIKKYIPDMEAGVDKYFRVLFLLRYRPGDFEEIYGSDDLVTFEQDLTELAAQAGESLLTMLQRFEPDQYAAQDN